MDERNEDDHVDKYARWRLCIYSDVAGYGFDFGHECDRLRFVACLSILVACPWLLVHTTYPMRPALRAILPMPDNACNDDSNQELQDTKTRNLDLTKIAQTN